MKKSIYLFITIVFVAFMILSQATTVKAASLDNIEVAISKEKIAPGEEVAVNVDFGVELGAYTINVDYDNNVFDYSSSEGGAANDTGSKVKLVYPSDLSTNDARRTAKITFKAKESILGSTPTNFAITLEGLSNADASETYDDITTPIEKDILVEPNYVDYSLTLNYEGTIEAKIAKDMTLITSSTMGKNYDHVRLIAEVTAEPKDEATTKLLAINENGDEIDLIRNGWGEADGYSIGGKDVKQELKLKGEFSDVGNYAIHVKLIDRDNSDDVIVEKTFNLAVAEKKQEENNGTTTKPEDNTNENKPSNEEEKLPAKLPKTGGTQYAIIIITVATLATAYYFVIKKNN